MDIIPKSKLSTKYWDPEKFKRRLQAPGGRRSACGGPGAVWEVCLTPNWTADTVQREDERLFLQTLIDVADAMERLQIGNERTRSLAKTFQEWLDKGAV